MPHKNNLADSTFAEIESPRRVALKQMSALFGLSLSAQALTALAEPAKSSAPSAAKFLSKNDLLMTGEIAQLIIPATETPGARDIDVHGFIDRYLLECVSKADQKKFTNGLKKINSVSESKFKKPFLLATNEQHIELLTAIEKKEFGFNAYDKEFFTFFKSLTLFGYYTSEVGATQELAYLAIPGGYKGNFPFSKVGKAWALN